MNKHPELKGTKIVAQSDLFTVEQIDLKFSNGEQRKFERLAPKGCGAVMVIPMLTDDTVLMIREYAAGTDSYEILLPKGRLECGESVLEAANREIKEEVGYGARKLQEIKALSLAPGYFSMKTHIVLAQDLYEEKLPHDEPEDIEVIPWRIDQLEQLFKLDEFTEARSMAALYMVRDHLLQQKK